MKPVKRSLAELRALRCPPNVCESVPAQNSTTTTTVTRDGNVTTITTTTTTVTGHNENGRCAFFPHSSCFTQHRPMGAWCTQCTRSYSPFIGCHTLLSSSERALVCPSDPCPILRDVHVGRTQCLPLGNNEACEF